MRSKGLIKIFSFVILWGSFGFDSEFAFASPVISSSLLQKTSKKSSIANQQSDYLKLVREQIKKCSAETYDEKKWQNLNLDLQSLKQALDENEMTLRSELRYRVVEFESNKGEKKRLRFAQEKSLKGIYNYNLRVERLDASGVGKEIPIPTEHKRQPTQLIVSEYLLNQRVLSDETLINESKLNDQEVNIRYLNGKIVEIEWFFSKSKKNLICEVRHSNYICRCRI